MASALSVREAAARLGIDVSRVRALLHAGELKGERIGGRWIVDPRSAQRRRGHAAPGRPFSPKRAWAYLLLLSGESVPWLDRATRSRLRRRIEDEPIRRVVPRLRARARAHHLRAGASALRAIAAAPGFVPSGVSAARAYRVALVVRDQLEGYVAEPDLRELQYRLALESVDAVVANLVLRVPALPSVLRGRKIAPAGVVAVDLLDSSDRRTSRAGEQLAERLRADRAAAR